MQEHECTEKSIIDQLDLKQIKDRVFKKHTVKCNCNLRDAIKDQMKATFKPGRAYYEFIHEIENIFKGLELIFMKEVIKQKWSLTNGILAIYILLYIYTRSLGTSSNQPTPVSLSSIGLLVKV